MFLLKLRALDVPDPEVGQAAGSAKIRSQILRKTA
jgi:hypothetical protein